MKHPYTTKLYTLVFGLFLGLCVWKFGNPVILDYKITPPATLSGYLNEPWPLHWANWMLLPLFLAGGLLIAARKVSWPHTRWLWLLPLIWLGWQLVSATKTVDANLTHDTLWQFFGCVACYFIGALLFAHDQLWRWLLPGLLAAFIFCMVRGIDQRVFEFPQDHTMLVEGERTGWTNFPSATVNQMKAESVIITTNGVDVANPIILKKFKNGRIAGTLVYPNALAGLILLLWPIALTLAFSHTKTLKSSIRLAVIGLTLFLGSVAFYWSGSKLGWLIGLAVGGLFLLRLNWPPKLKLTLISLLMIVGLGAFGLRFHHYFANGATSVVARFDYWRAAIQTTMSHPVFGTGPGTFQRPYAQIKAPEAEMARLTHNDYLEQFSDSGFSGGLAYMMWVFWALMVATQKIWRNANIIFKAILGGLLGWFAQGFGEFSLYIPALAWTAFTLLGLLIGLNQNKFDK